jgi:hypothetical protein
MKLELLILGITIFFIFNTYYDGKFMKMLLSWKKYYQMIFFGIVGISIYLLLKRNPVKGKNMLLYANNMVKYLPIDRSSIDMLTPIFDFTTSNQMDYSDNTNNNGIHQPRSFMESFNDITLSPSNYQNAGERRINHSGKMATKRSVSETKKKYVASQQNWKCGNCQDQLNAWFEVDHKIRLEHGGGNDVANLVALCRECHGKKTAMENM